MTAPGTACARCGTTPPTEIACADWRWADCAYVLAPSPAERTPTALVQAAARAMCDGSHGWTQPCDLCDELAEVAVAALVPLIRAQAFADAAAVFARCRDQWIAERGLPDYSERAEFAYTAAAIALTAWAADPTVIDATLAKIAVEGTDR